MGLRPRLVTPKHLEELEIYAKILFKDIYRVEEDWRAGKLDDLIPLPENELEVIKLRERELSDPAQIACDGLFDFGACK